MSGIKDRLILASGSPQRFSLLVAAGFKPEVRVPEVDESILVGESANSLVERLAVKKLDAVINVGECGVAADTVVSINEKILGKPGTPEIALEMLQTLSGVTHQVITGVALSGPKGRRSLIVGNSLRVVVVAATRLVDAVRDSQLEIEAMLSLGFTRHKAVKRIVSETLKLSLIPQIETTRTVGVVFLPGMLTGLILAGVDPLEAALMQAIILFLILGSAAITGLIVVLLGAQKFLTADHRLEAPEL